MAKQFEKLDILVTDLNKSFGKLTVDSTGLRSLASATNATDKAFIKADLSAAAYERRLAGIHATTGKLAAQAFLTGAAPGAVFGGRGASPAAGGMGGGGGRHVAPGGFHGGNIHVGAGGIGLGTAGIAAGDWFLPLAATGAMIYAGHSLFESAKELDTERNKFRQFGLSSAQNQEAFRYIGGMNIYGTSKIEQTRAFRESQGVFRESGLDDSRALEGAKLAAPILSKLDFLASSLDDESAATMKTANLNMLRYVESSGGLKSAEAFNRIADFGYKLNVSSGGTVDWAQLRQFKARAGAAGFNLTDDAMSRLEPVIAEMKGGAVGFGLSTAFNRLTGSIRIPNQVAHQLVDQGIWDPHKIVFNSNGGIKTFTGNPLGQDNSNLLLTNPELFYERVIRPIYDRLKLSTTDIARENVMLFGTTGGRNMTLIENQIAAINRSVSAMQKTKGIDASVAIAKESLTGQQKEFEAAWTDFKTQWGTTMLPFFTGILKGGAEILRTIGPNGMEAHPNIRAGIDIWSSLWDQGFIGTFATLVGGAIGQHMDGKGDSRYVASSKTGPMTVTVPVMLDKKVLATATAQVFTRDLDRPQHGVNFHDDMLSASPAGGIFN